MSTLKIAKEPCTNPHCTRDCLCKQGVQKHTDTKSTGPPKKDTGTWKIPKGARPLEDDGK